MSQVKLSDKELERQGIKPAAWPFWKTLMFLGVPFLAYKCYLYGKSSGNWFPLVFAPYGLFLVSVLWKSIYEDRFLKKANPEYVTTLEFSRPFLIALALWKGPVILLFIGAAIYVWFFKM